MTTHRHHHHILHLVNGETSVVTLKRNGIEGDIHSIDDIFMEGPVVNGLRSDEDWRFRAAVLQQQLDIPADRYLATRKQREELLNKIEDYPEAVLWFEQDLFCQINIVQTLDWLARHQRPLAKLKIAASGATPMLARVCQVEEAFARKLLDARQPVSAQRVALAQATWQAYTDPDPSRLVQLLHGGDFTAWPELQRGIELHLQRFPARATGFDAIESTLVSFIAESGRAGLSFLDLLTRFASDAKALELGLGDQQLRSYLRGLAAGPSPLVDITGDDSVTLTARLTATQHGEALLSGALKAAAPRALDRWVGGVHLTAGAPRWHWDASSRTVAKA